MISKCAIYLWQVNAQKQKGQTLNSTSTQKAIDILKVFHIRNDIYGNM